MKSPTCLDSEIVAFFIGPEPHASTTPNFAIIDDDKIESGNEGWTRCVLLLVFSRHLPFIKHSLLPDDAADFLLLSDASPTVIHLPVLATRRSVIFQSIKRDFPSAVD